MIEIKTEKIKNSEVTVPGSKSYTHRMLIAAALSEGICTLENSLKSEDTILTQNALQQMGIKMEERHDKLLVHGAKGAVKSCKEPVYLANSGTSMRLLTSVAALGDGTYTLTGTRRMCRRPIRDLVDGLNRIGVRARCVNNDGCPPVEINGGPAKGGHLSLKCDISSQYLSSLLLIAPYADKGLEIQVVKGPVSKPYIDMTVDIMTSFGVKVERDGYARFKIPGGQTYRSGAYTVEPDCSQAGYFWAAAAITGRTIKVKGISRDSRQGDVRFTEVLESMGCSASHEKDGIAVSGKTLSPIEVDMADMPDIVPTLAVVAAFAEGTTVIKNVAHLRAKESDRLEAVSRELSKIGIKATATDNTLIIKGGHPVGPKSGRPVIETYNDHRIAMSFAVAGLVVPGIVIRDEQCVEKSFPDFWNIFKGLYES